MTSLSDGAQTCRECCGDPRGLLIRKKCNRTSKWAHTRQNDQMTKGTTNSHGLQPQQVKNAQEAWLAWLWSSPESSPSYSCWLST